MKTIHKFTVDAPGLEWSSVVVIPCSPGSRLTTVAKQSDKMVIYYLTDDAQPKTSTLRVWIVGTGNPCKALPDDVICLGTVSMFGGTLMFHVFCDHRERLS
jgi:hypothetical protein